MNPVALQPVNEPRVFVVEDDDAVREGLCVLLRGEGYDVEGYANALDFLTKTVPRSDDVVVLDVGLPDIDGHRVAKLLRKLGERPKIIAMSGLRRDAFDRSVREMAPDLAYRKPLNLRALLRGIVTLQPYGALRT